MEDQEKILLVDDDAALVELVAEFLRREGFEVEAVHDGEAGVARALSGEHALIVLDVMLPGIGGFEALRRIRSAPPPASRLPILMLSARGEEIDRVMGLEWGADDYLSKPHSPRELVARIRATLRRVQLDQSAGSGSSGEAGAKLRVGEVEWEGAARLARVRGEEVDLTAAEFDLLGVLMRHAGEVVSRESISREVFDRPLLHFDRALDVHISNLRRKLSAKMPDAEHEPIKTVRGVGYVFAKI